MISLGSSRTLGCGGLKPVLVLPVDRGSTALINYIGLGRGGEEFHVYLRLLQEDVTP